MHINIFSIAFVIILALFISGNDSEKNRRAYIFVCSAVLLFIASMRSPEWTANYSGIDTVAYKTYFDSSFDMDWSEFWSTAYLRYIKGVGDGDIGFLLLVKIIGFFTHDFAIYSLLVDLLFFIPFGILLYRYCDSIVQITFAFVFYIALIQVFLLAGGRQLFAFGFDLMALLAILDGRKARTVIFVLIATTIHFSSLLFVVPLLLLWKDVSAETIKKAHLLCFVVFPLVLAFPNQIIVLMGESVGMEKYAEYGKGGIVGGALTFIILIAFLSVFCYVAIKKDILQENEVMRKFYVMLPLMTFFAPLIRSNGSMIRISLYFHFFLALLVPYAIECMFVNNRRTGYLLAIGSLAFLCCSDGGIVYYFHWQL